MELLKKAESFVNMIANKFDLEAIEFTETSKECVLLVTENVPLIVTVDVKLSAVSFLLRLDADVSVNDRQTDLLIRNMLKINAMSPVFGGFFSVLGDKDVIFMTSYNIGLLNDTLLDILLTKFIPYAKRFKDLTNEIDAIMKHLSTTL